jgi:hypothetical protein
MPSESTRTPTDSPSPITAVEVTRQAVVVDLRADADVSELSLIGPDGEAVSSTTVAAGETQVTLPILEVNPEITGYEHYTPGEHELVAITEAGEVSRTLPLQPQISIEFVEQYRNGSSSQDLGRVMVILRNQGTGPTWAYDITFNQAPNYSANTDLTENIGLPYVETPSEVSSVQIPPDATRRYISQFAPLILPEDEYDCNGDVANFSMRVGIASGTVLNADLSASFEGKKEPADITGNVVCNETTVTTQEVE